MKNNIINKYIYFYLEDIWDLIKFKLILVINFLIVSFITIMLFTSFYSLFPIRKKIIYNYLIEQSAVDDLNLEFSISAATREARGEEVNGKDYYFMSIEEFKKHIKAEDFVEWEEVYRDNFYGTLKSEVERIWAMGKHVIFDIDQNNILQVSAEETSSGQYEQITITNDQG